MKKITLLLVLFLATVTFAQQGINYKALIKDSGGNVVASTAITVQFIIYEGAGETTIAYQETHMPTTDANGIIILNIGKGTTSDVFADIDWAADEHFLNTQIDTGDGLTNMGTTQFMAVPYSLHALSAANVSGLETITEGGNTGHRLIGRNPANHGNIGIDAIDFSVSSITNTILGATGSSSIAMGIHTTASGSFSTAMGTSTTASGFNSTAMGGSTTASGFNSTAMGSITNANSLSSTAIGSYNIGGGDPVNWVPTDPLFEIGNGLLSPSNALTVLKNGSVGIGTATPSQKLDVVGSAEINGNTTITGNVGIGTTTPSQKLDVVGSAEINGNATITGNVGIGTTTPAYPLHITTSISDINSSPAYFLHQTAGHGANGGGWFYSIGATGGVYSSLGFGTGSDHRIKNIIGVSDANKDLNHLLDIEITNYTFKDFKKRGDKVTKKVIAQQLKEVLPNAIIYSTEFIPNIYALADIHIKDEKTVQLHLNNSPDVVVGDIIKLIAKNNQELEATIIAVIDTTIEVSIKDTKNLGNQLFVYGKQVDDFHSVDYDAISMLNVSATQAQQKLIEALQKEIEGLKNKNNELQAEVSKIADLEKEMTEIKAMLFTNLKTNTLTQN